MINFIVWLIIGGLIGWVASMIMRTDGQQGMLLNVIVGIVGAAIGGWLISPLVGVGTINQGGFSYLEVAINKSAGDTRENPPYRSPPLESTGWGLHLVDYNLELDDLIEAVRLQAAAKK